MVEPTQSFREFEVAGWQDTSVCSNYDHHLSALTTQAIGALLDAAGIQRGTRVLDVATGAGYAAAAAAERGADATGVDFSASQVTLARTRNPKLRFEQSDADALPFPAESFDSVVSNFGMCHFPDPNAAMREAFRVLTPAGRVAFTVWSTPEKAVGFGAIYGAVRAHGSLDVGLPAGPNFFLFSDPEQCRRVLIEAGFHAPLVSEIKQVWRVSAPEQVFDIILQGSVRAAAMLRGQTPEARAAIRSTVRDTISAYRKGPSYEVPMPAVLATAAKPKP